VGIEDIRDIVADLTQGLQKATGLSPKAGTTK
jgi:hypothetical protein